MKTAKIDRLWFATFIYFNKRAGVQWVDLSLVFQYSPQEGGVLNPLLLKKPGFLPNLLAITKDFAQ
ncbi:hypothetical protein D0A37_17835 [Microcoleus vaginatus HSN003]|nr:hypothetical protein D0A37_17835 [Microcoleus vaginatus HSN003]